MAKSVIVKKNKSCNFEYYLNRSSSFHCLVEIHVLARGISILVKTVVADLVVIK